MNHKDLFGKALLDFYHNNYTEDIITWTNISDKDVLSLPYLFRTYDKMPSIEQRALQLAKGSVLDVGCGAGNHSLWLQEKGLSVKGIDISKGAIEVCEKRRLTRVNMLDLRDETNQYDTILVLMNGTGIFENMQLLPSYLKHLKSLLKVGGQVLIDSSDICYMYDTVPKVDLENYYGALYYYLSYKNEIELPMQWLYLDFKTLQVIANEHGFNCEKILDGEHYDYLARLTSKD